MPPDPAVESIEQLLVTIEKNRNNDGHHGHIEYLTAE